MKKIYFSLMLIGALTFSSCSMDKAPYGSLDDKTAIEKAQDLRQFRNSLYSGMRAVTSGGWLYDSDIQMDEFHGLISNGNQVGNFANGLINASDADIKNFWASSYALIATCNGVIEHADEMADMEKFSDSEKGDFARYKAEAQFVRAYMYFWLADHFCQSYTRCEPSKAASGMPLVTRYNPTGNLADYPSRSTLDETYTLIENDLQAAYDGLKLYENNHSDVASSEMVKENAAYISSYAVKAMQARVALVKGDWQTAATDAEDVINSGRYKLTTTKDYSKLWTNDEGTEVIFRPLMTATELGNSNGAPFVSESETKASYIPTYGTLELFWDVENEVDHEGDVRADIFLKFYDNLQVEGSSYEAYVMSKFNGNANLRVSSSNNLMNMSKPYRLAEMYLIAAEAETRLGNEDAANQYFNTFLRNRIVDYRTKTYTREELLSALRKERQLEFIGEGMRMSDIRRYGIGFKREAHHEENESLDNVIVKSGSALEYAADDYRLTWPIPKEEIDSNPKLASEQNPGY